ncbi:hypothetical protein PTKIN_Ptkin14bG0190700 [Pterospermum kingtungense]
MMMMMLRPKPPLFGLLALAFSLLLLPHAYLAKDCGSTFCGKIKISYPFRLNTQPRKCGFKEFELVRENNRTIFPFTRHGSFHVQHIFYANQTIHLLDVNLVNKNCSLPNNSFPMGYPDNYYSTNSILWDVYPIASSIIFLVNCSMKMNSSEYIDASRCSTNGPSPPTQPTTNFFYFLDGATSSSHFHQSCIIEAEVPIMAANISGLSTFDIYNELVMGIQLSWYWTGLISSLYWDSIYNVSISVVTLSSRALDVYAHSIKSVFAKEDVVSLDDYSKVTQINKGTLKGLQIVSVAITVIVVLRTVLGVSCLIALVTHKIRRRHLSMDDKIEKFLQSQNNLMPIRYSYSEIRRMTEGFKNMLGQGGYGSVFKGKLRSGQLVAIKLLNQSKADGQDFINEVATIGRIHHVNVVRLIGFCVKGSKRALVYDFMTNGSLDKIIFSGGSSNLSWQKMWEIALGVAQGVEYLHKGCVMQILHFDIKPHNILLDENFNPKISDFGLAKLHSVDNDVISLTAARGTFGYMAPELFYKNIGDISHKADVYSFGMMLMKIVGRRKNLNSFAEHSSQIYFPSWIYDRLDKGENVELGDVTECENKIVRKMMIVAFWCIQLKPTDRPSMSKVLKMLESEVELLEMPPKPFSMSPEMSMRD